jgi:hypothetical protein
MSKKRTFNFEDDCENLQNSKKFKTKGQFFGNSKVDAFESIHKVDFSGSEENSEDILLIEFTKNKVDGENKEENSKLKINDGLNSPGKLETISENVKKTIDKKIENFKHNYYHKFDWLVVDEDYYYQN